jgi:hypothetical protein
LLPLRKYDNMRFFDVSNTGKGSKAHFIIAKDEEDARRIARTQTGVPTTVVELPAEDNIPKLLESGKTGILAKNIVAMRASDLFSGKTPKQPEEPWVFVLEV